MPAFIMVIIAIIVIAIVWFIGIYNGLVKARQRVDASWSDIDVQLKRRYDLVPNLVETVKGYAKHEQNVFENVTKARAQAMSATTPGQHAQAENMLTGALKSLFAVAENYPELKASENFAKLQDELSDTENKIQAARRFYNENVRDFNTKIETFPNNMMASSYGFTQREYFQIEGENAKEMREPVSVKF
ncbi:MAG: LemA family protein [bacterium]|nr:LemA family protein [bacterium]